MSVEQDDFSMEEEAEEEEDEPPNSPVTLDEEDDGEPKICKACGDKATGYHFNAMTCEGCKGFFRRAMKRNLRLSCPFQNSCVINRSNRRHCQACRLKKCLDIGMKKELIMSDEAVKKRRALIKRRQKVTLLETMSPSPTMTDEQRLLVEQMTEAHKRTFDYNFTYFRDFRPVQRQQEPTDILQPTSSTVFLMLPHISDLVTYIIEGVINFAKIIPQFRNLSIEDQIALLKGCALELCVIRFNTVFNMKSCTWECGDLTYSVPDLGMAGFRQLFLEPLVRVHSMLKKLKLRNEEYALMQAISLFSSDRPGVTDHKTINKIQEDFALTLVAYIEAERQPAEESRFLFAKITECLTELRSMNDEHSKQVLQTWDIQPDCTPLMLEVFSQLQE
ncbi:nuclear receptor subfamily 1 group I member 2 [Hyperolius riggenbachi]|uniref:nuclear receptor subfamily 1 group I member 2 n=1 Tax=Hyperolius riggenbachi TaxID=752182 RepID=UPI0035A2BFC5